MKELTKIRLLMVLYTPLDYIRGYFKHKKLKNLKDYYKNSYNRFFICIWKDIWTTGKIDKNIYTKPSRKFTPRLSKEMRSKLIGDVNDHMKNRKE